MKTQQCSLSILKTENMSNDLQEYSKFTERVGNNYLLTVLLLMFQIGTLLVFSVKPKKNGMRAIS